MSKRTTSNNSLLLKHKPNCKTNYWTHRIMVTLIKLSCALYASHNCKLKIFVEMISRVFNRNKLIIIN